MLKARPPRLEYVASLTQDRQEAKRTAPQPDQYRGKPAVNEAQRPLAVAASGTAPVGASPAFAALGPAFQQILLQAATANGGNGAASAQQAVQQASAMALLQKVLPTGALQRGQGGAAPAAAGGALTTRDGQLLVPIAWPLPGGGSSTQLLNLPPGALQALAAQMANAQPGAAVAAAPAAPGGGAHPAAAGGVSGGNGDFAGDGSPTPAVADGAAVPSSDDQSSGQGGEQGSDTSGADGAAPLSGRRKQPRVLQSGVDDGKEDPAPGSHRMTPSKRKPPRTMTAALM